MTEAAYTLFTKMRSLHTTTELTYILFVYHFLVRAYQLGSWQDLSRSDYLNHESYFYIKYTVIN